MPLASFLDTMLERAAALQEAQRVKTQAAAWRAWARLGSGGTAMFPVGRQYERMRLDQPDTLRPTNFLARFPKWAEGMQRRAQQHQNRLAVSTPPPPSVVPAAELIRQGHAPTSILERQRLGWGMPTMRERMQGMTAEQARPLARPGEIVATPTPVPTPPMPVPTPAMPAPDMGLQNLARAFAPTQMPVLQVQQNAFQGRSLQDLGGGIAKQFFEQLPTPQERQQVLEILQHRPSNETLQAAQEQYQQGQLPEERYLEIFSDWKQNQLARQQMAPALGLLDAPFILGSEAAGKVAEAAGAPPWAQTTAQIVTPLAMGLGTGVGISRLPGALRSPAQILAASAGAEPGRGLPRAPIPGDAFARLGVETARGAPLETGIRRGVEAAGEPPARLAWPGSPAVMSDVPPAEIAAVTAPRTQVPLPEAAVPGPMDFGEAIRRTAAESVGPPPAPPRAAVAGDEVLDVTGRRWHVVDASDPETLRVEDDWGTWTNLDRKGVTVTSPRPGPAPAAAAPNVARETAAVVRPGRVAVGDEVIDTAGRRWRVTDDSDPAVLGVENDQGTQTHIGRDAVTPAPLEPAAVAPEAPPEPAIRAPEAPPEAAAPIPETLPEAAGGAPATAEEIGPRTVAELGLQRGQRVVAADTGRSGRIVSFSKDGDTANVHFVDHSKGTESTVTLPVHQLEPMNEGLSRRLLDIFTRTGPDKDTSEAVRLYNGYRSEGRELVQMMREDTRGLVEQAGIDPKLGGMNRQSDETIQFMDRFWGMVDPETQNTPRGAVGIFPDNQRPLVRALHDKLDQDTELVTWAYQMLGIDPKTRLLDDYVPHLFKREKGPGRGGAGFRTRLTGRRTLQGSLVDLLKADSSRDLATWNPVEVVAQHSADVHEFVGSVVAIRKLMDQGLIVQLSKGHPRPMGWRTPRIKPFQMGEMRNWVADPAVATGLEKMFGESIFKSNGALKFAEDVRNTAFMVKVFGGGFQIVDFSWRNLGKGLTESLREISPVRRVGKGVDLPVGFKLNLPRAGQSARQFKAALFNPIRAIARASIPGMDAKMRNIVMHNPWFREAYRLGHGAGADVSVAEGAIRGLGRLVPTSVGGHEIPPMRVLQKIVNFVSGEGYRRFHQDMLDQGFIMTLQKHLDRLEGHPLLQRRLTLDDLPAMQADPAVQKAIRDAIDENNIFFSSPQHYQDAIKDANVRGGLRFAWFAIGELQGLARMPIQSPAGFAGIIGATVMASEMLNKLSTGHWLSTDQLKPYSGEGVHMRYNTAFLRPELPWRGPMGRRVFLDILGQADTWFRVVLDPAFAAQTRLGQLPRLGWDLAAIKRGEAPPFGEVVKTPKDWLKFGAQEASPIAINALTGTEKGRIGLLGAGIQASGFNVSAQGFRDLVADRFKEKYGTEMDTSPASPHWKLVTNDPEFADIFEEMQKRGMKEGWQAAEARNQLETAITNEAAQRGLERLLPDMLAGDPAASQQWLERYKDLEQFRADALTYHFTDADALQPESDGAAAVLALRDLNPYSAKFETPDTREPDWDAYFDEVDKQLAVIERYAPGYTEAYKNQTILPEQYAEAERTVMRAERVRDELGDIKKYPGLSVEQQHEVGDFMHRVEAWRRQQGRRMPVQEAMGQYGRAEGISSKEVNRMRGYRARMQNRERTAEYVDFLRRNQSILRRFYPGLYTQYIIGRLAA